MSRIAISQPARRTSLVRQTVPYAGAEHDVAAPGRSWTIGSSSGVADEVVSASTVRCGSRIRSA